MSQLPLDAIRAADFLVRHLYRPIDVTAGSRYFAIGETENSADDDWFWNDDNAKVLEFMSRPEIWSRFPQQTGEILRFVRSMCRGPFIFRRVAGPRLELAERREMTARYLHSLMQVKCDLQRGTVIAGLRYHDDRSPEQLMLAGNFVEFAYRGQRFRLAVDKAAGVVDVRECGGKLTIRNSTDLKFTSRWRERRLGQLCYTQVLDVHSMLIEVEAALALEPGIRVSDVVLTIGHPALDVPRYSDIAVTKGAGATLFTAGQPGLCTVESAGASYYSIMQGSVSGDALAIHTVPREPARLSGIAAVVNQPDRLYYAGARYSFPGVHEGARLVAAEHKLITTGGFYHRVADYAAFLHDAIAAKRTDGAAYDLSISYDYGVTINALAKCFAVCASGMVLPEPAFLLDDVHSLVDELLRHYFDLYVDRHEQQPNAMFSRELAFVMLGVTTMYRATGSDDYRRQLQRMCDVLLDFEMPFEDYAGCSASGFLMRKDSPRASYVDCHSAVLLALTQAAGCLDDPRLAATIDRGLASYGLTTSRGLGAAVDTISTVMMDEHGNRNTADAFWNFKVGITLRFFAALRNAEPAALQTVVARHEDRMALLELIMRRQIDQSITTHADGVEIRCSIPSATTNSESQPWTVLGLVGHPCD